MLVYSKIIRKEKEPCLKLKKIIKCFFYHFRRHFFLFIGFIVLTETGIIKLHKEEIPSLNETKADIICECEEIDYKRKNSIND
ncbi:hypothetical protein C6B37_01195 [Candidatus Phytoplasma phoenicium]|uniref:Uncharacterized protein n=1 Tax=Candidatus Phytoplasma phoenicium TaxID=198422 RepID=A0A2S8NV09_9MOLU|nr:hypothetical protein C6B37_01195 [Candidatus Phytoplasma phoenicium]